MIVESSLFKSDCRSHCTIWIVGWRSTVHHTSIQKNVSNDALATDSFFLPQCRRTTLEMTSTESIMDVLLFWHIDCTLHSFFTKIYIMNCFWTIHVIGILLVGTLWYISFQPIVHCLHAQYSISHCKLAYSLCLYRFQEPCTELKKIFAFLPVKYIYESLIIMTMLIPFYCSFAVYCILLFYTLFTDLLFCSNEGSLYKVT